MGNAERFYAKGVSVRGVVDALAAAHASIRHLASFHNRTDGRTDPNDSSRMGRELARDSAATDLSRAILLGLDLGKEKPVYDCAAVLEPMAMDAVRIKAAAPFQLLDHAWLISTAEHVEHCRATISSLYERKKRAALAAARKAKSNVSDG